MSLTKSSNEKKYVVFFQRILNWIFYLIFLLIVAEVSASFALDIYRKNRNDSTYFKSMDSSLAQELELVQRQLTLSQYRGYQNLSNFQGTKVITDAGGFRIDRRALDDRIKVGMFGGSTTFSVLTDQKGTIADQISQQSDIYQVLNFGVGGYSTSAEIMTLVEAIRSYPNLRMAFFYDGVNELGRAIEGGSKGVNPSESEFLLGTPYVDGIRSAIKNANGYGFSVNQSNLLYIYNRLLRPTASISFDGIEFLSSVKERYFANIKVLKGICNEYNLKCFFIVQPSIFSTKEFALNESELSIKEKEIYGKLYPQLTEMILSDNRAKNYGVIDMTAALNNKSNTERVFFDWHHLNSLGNKYIADKIKVVIDNKILD